VSVYVPTVDGHMPTESLCLNFVEKIFSLLVSVINALDSTGSNDEQLDAMAYERIQRYKYQGL